MKVKLFALAGLATIILGILGIKKLREDTHKAEMEVNELEEQLKEQFEMTRKLHEQIQTANEDIDEQIRESKELIRKLKEEFGIDPKDYGVEED